MSIVAERSSGAGTGRRSFVANAIARRKPARTRKASRSPWPPTRETRRVRCARWERHPRPVGLGDEWCGRDGDNAVVCATIRPLADTTIAVPSPGRGTLWSMSDAVVGGVLGAAVAFALTQVSAASVAWREVTLHDDEATGSNERLVAWVDAETIRLARTMQEIGDDFSSRNAFTSSATGTALAQAKTEALQRYRDEEERASIALARLKASALVPGAAPAWLELWRPSASRAARRASSADAGPLTPALLLRQERGHQARADAGFRSGRI
jgi:hypothetical protein